MSEYELWTLRELTMPTFGSMESIYEKLSDRQKERLRAADALYSAIVTQQVVEVQFTIKTVEPKKDYQPPLKTTTMTHEDLWCLMDLLSKPMREYAKYNNKWRPLLSTTLSKRTSIVVKPTNPPQADTTGTGAIDLSTKRQATTDTGPHAEGESETHKTPKLEGTKSIPNAGLTML